MMVKLAFEISSVLFAVAIHIFFNESLAMFDRWLRPAGVSMRLKRLSLVVNTCSFALLIAQGLCTPATQSRPYGLGEPVQESDVASGDDNGMVAPIDTPPYTLDEGQFSKLVVDDFLAGNTTGGIALVSQSR
ncbi:hypothetical protein C8Q79DRAFT_197485 [Trametes meyenii]|nr:hypothetical protein C8Q79DRAFT_197485 [Trametes meyenii]